MDHRTISMEELKVLQLDILSVIDTFCRKEGINYSLGCGSMLGAARHKGYIPWDDDVDIYLLREDYIRLVQSFPESIDNVVIASLERDNNWNRAYAKAMDRRTVLIDAGEKQSVGIDVYPIDRVPNDEDDWRQYDKKRRFYQLIFKYKISMWFRKGRELWKYLLIPFVKFFLLPFPSRKIAIFIDKYCKKHNGSNSGYVFECCQGLLQKNRFRRSVLENTVDMPFEDRVFRGMVDYDEYLTNAYGDWRKLPPKEKRVPHHLFEAWWKDYYYDS